jgi:hypothetical protein
MCGEINFNHNIPADLERRMHRFETLRTSERKTKLSCATLSASSGAPRRWSAEDDERLVMMYSDNMSLRYIAHILHRSEAAVRRRLSLLHLPRKK